MHKRKVQDFPFSESSEKRDEWPGFRKPPDQDQFYASLVAAKDTIMCQIEESGWNVLSSPKEVEQNNVKAKLTLNSVHEESIPSVGSIP